MLREGDVVSWVGTGAPGGPAVGDVGRVASSSGNSGHVLWTTGSRSGRVDLVAEWDVVPAPTVPKTGHSVTASLTDSLSMDGVHTAVRDTFEESGPAGLLSAMHALGDLACFATIAEEALILVATRLREDPQFAHTLAALDDPDADSLVSLASSVLLRDAFTEEG